MTASPPPGFAPHTRHSPATVSWEPIYARSDTGVFQLGIIIADAHCNTRGTLHGGVMATLADNACGLTLGMALGFGAKGVFTTSLAIDYVGPGKLGQWLEIMPRLVKAGTSSGVVDALITADGVVVARANASFRLLG
jgi:uncharacterized protein (TIGR00369 family)